MASNKEKQYQKDLQKLIKGQYQAGQQFIQSQQANLERYQPQYEQAIAGAFEAQAPEIQRIAEQQKTAIAGQQEQTKQQRESALATARRQYQEGTQRTQQLFGGVAGSSAGTAQSELLAREQARQIGQTQMESGRQLGQLATNLQNVETQTANQLMQLQADKQKALTQARDQFRQQLDAINSQRFQLAQDKSNKQIQALQDFNTRRRQLEDFYKQQEASLSYYKAQQPIALATYERQLQLAKQYGTGSATGGLANLAGLSLSALNITNPDQAKMLAQQISTNPDLQKAYNATVSPDKTKLMFTDTATKQYGEIPLK